MTAWASVRARAVLALWPVVALVLSIGVYADEQGPAPMVAALVAAVFVVRALRIEMRLEPDVLYVRNLLRTYRIRYADIARVREEWKDVVAKNDRHVVGSYLLGVFTEDVHYVEILATWWLSETDREVAREMLTQLVPVQPDDDEDEEVDESPPFR